MGTKLDPNAHLKSYLDRFLFVKGYFTGDSDILEFFKTHPISTSSRDVLLKLNSCTSNNGNGYDANISELAKYTYDGKLDERFALTDLDAVDAMMNFDSKSGFYLLDTASRYGNWHNPLIYPIYNQRSLAFLNELKPERTYVKGYYADFRERLIIQKNDAGLAQLNFKQLDKFLWLYPNCQMKLL